MKKNYRKLLERILSLIIVHLTRKNSAEDTKCMKKKLYMLIGKLEKIE